METSKKDMRAELLEKSPLQLMIKLSVPAIIGMLVIGLYSLVDAVYVGQLINPNAMGAISVVYPFTLINITSRIFTNFPPREKGSAFPIFPIN